MLQTTREGVLLEVLAKPNSRVVGVVGRHGDRLKVALRQPPENGRANHELVALLAESLALPRSSVELIRGGASRQKTIRLRGISIEELQSRLDQLLEQRDQSVEPHKP